MGGIERGQSERMSNFCGRYIYFGPHFLHVCFNWIRSICRSMSLFLFCWFPDAFDTLPWDMLWEHLQQLGVPLHLQQVVNAMCTTIYAKVQINVNTHGGAMFNIFVRQECLLSPTLCGLYIDELEHLWSRLTWILCVYFTQWLPFFFMLIMLFSIWAWRCRWSFTSKCILRLPIMFWWLHLENLPWNYTLLSSLWIFNTGLSTYPPLG